MKFIVKVEVEVVETESTSEGKKAAYDLAATLNASKRGRRAAGPVASVVGITVEEWSGKDQQYDFLKEINKRPEAITGSILRTHSTDGSGESKQGVRSKSPMPEPNTIPAVNE